MSHSSGGDVVRTGRVKDKVVGDRELITRYIEKDPRRPSLANARLIDSGVPIWALIGHYNQAVGQDLERVAADYEIPLAAAKAALAFYREHTAIIDDRIAANNPSAD